jgi:hypothetical protein
LKNAVVIASRLGEFAWARDVMQRFEQELQKAARLSAFHFGWGTILYHERDLDRAEPHYHRVLDHAEDVHYSLDARGYLLRIYYETGNIIGLDALLASFRMFLKRSADISGDRKARYNAFIRFAHRLAHTAPHDKESLLQLRERILAARRIPPTAWLLERVEGLLGEG